VIRSLALCGLWISPPSSWCGTSNRDINQWIITFVSPRKCVYRRLFKLCAGCQYTRGKVFVVDGVRIVLGLKAKCVVLHTHKQFKNVAGNNTIPSTHLNMRTVFCGFAEEVAAIQLHCRLCSSDGHFPARHRVLHGSNW
jgi:hypothetical protein